MSPRPEERDDVAERLRDWRITGHAGPLRREAADLIESQAAELAALRSEREQMAARIAELEGAHSRAAIKTKLLEGFRDRSPFCPEHRDKVSGKPCRECEIERLTRALSEYRGDERAGVERWRPIETAPKDGTPILVWDESMGSYNQAGAPDDRRYAVGYWRVPWGGGWGNRNNAHPAPTHWMPLPAPPAEPRTTPASEPGPANPADPSTREEP